jgi:hypothetical protein
MPLSGGTSGAHDDAMHQGNAKRAVASGVAPLTGAGLVSDQFGNAYERQYFKDRVSGYAALDAAGALLVPGSKIYYTRDGSDDVHIYERTSDEEAYAFHRVGADDYTFFVKESNVWKRMQTESMKDVANGIAGLDANARLVAGRIGVGSQRADHRSKIASANLRNSHDATDFVTDLVFTKSKTFHITNGVSGVLRIKHDNFNHIAGEHTYTRVYKNGVALGAIQDNSAADSWVTYSEDLDVGVMQSGETLELWTYVDTNPGPDHQIRNFRLHYDNAPFHVVADTITTP